MKNIRRCLNDKSSEHDEALFFSEWFQSGDDVVKTKAEGCVFMNQPSFLVPFSIMTSET